jgi:hypothetical protein
VTSEPTAEILSGKNAQARVSMVSYLKKKMILNESPILGQLLDLISPAKINLFEPRFKSYDPWDMANCLP